MLHLQGPSVTKSTPIQPLGQQHRCMHLSISFQIHAIDESVRGYWLAYLMLPNCGRCLKALVTQEGISGYVPIDHLVKIPPLLTASHPFAVPAPVFQVSMQPFQPVPCGFARKAKFTRKESHKVAQIEVCSEPTAAF